jgi:3-isopropylmalate dehydrogenase
LSDLTAELSGSIGLGGSLNSGVNHAMGQAAHGSAPDIAGQNIANPLSLVLSASMLLGWYGQRQARAKFLEASKAINEAVAQAILAQEATADVGGKLGTAETGTALAKRLTA